MVGDAKCDGRARSDGLDGGEDLADVLALCGEGSGARGPGGVVAEEVAYSFMVLPQPAALMTMVSTLAASKVAIIFFA